MVKKMEGYVLDSSFETLGILDDYYSFIWTERFRGAGDLEYKCYPTTEALDVLQIGRYIMNTDSDHLMVIEEIGISSDPDTGVIMQVNASGVETFLRRRIVQNYKYAIDGDVSTEIWALIQENRPIPNLIFRPNASVSGRKITYEAEGNNLYDLIDSFCEYLDIGWRIVPDYTNKRFIFELFDGADRSYSQDKNPWIVFSPSYDNLISTNYFSSRKEYFNAAFVYGPRKYIAEYDKLIQPENGASYYQKTPHTFREDLGFWVYLNGEVSGIGRREMYLDYSSTSWEKPDEEQPPPLDSSQPVTISYIDSTLIPVSEMTELLTEEAKAELQATQPTDAYDGEVEAIRQFTYPQDFQIGDICQMKDEFGREMRIRISEVMQSNDQSGYLIVPTFTKV